MFGFEQPDADADELRFRSLWKLFYDTVSIDERTNSKCRMTHMQKRYWKHMTEMQECVVPKIGEEDRQSALAKYTNLVLEDYSDDYFVT